MYQITVIDQPSIKGFTPSPINGKISGASLKIRIAITNDGAILQPQNPVRICAWLRTSQRQPFKCLSTTSGKKDDLLWTEKAALQGSLTLEFPIALGDLDKTSFPKIAFHGAQLRIRADLSQSLPTPSDGATLLDTCDGPKSGLQSSKLTSPKNRWSKSSILKDILDQGTMHVPLNVVAIGIDCMHDATHLATALTFKMWKNLASQKLSVAHFKPSTIVVAEKSKEVVTRDGEDWTAESWARKCIKADYINRLIKALFNPHLAVRLKFHNLDSLVLGDVACDRAWSLMIATDDFQLNEATRKSKADEIKAVTMSSVWRSPDKAPPKLLISRRGPSPKGQMSLLDMVKSDGWEIIEQCKKLPDKLFPEAPKRSGMTYALLENGLKSPNYVEIDNPSKDEHGRIVNGPDDVADNSTSQITGEEAEAGHDIDMQCINTPNQGSKSPDLHNTQSQASSTSIAPRAKRILEWARNRKREAPDSHEHSEQWAERRDQLGEQRQATMQGAHTESSLAVASSREAFLSDDNKS